MYLARRQTFSCCHRLHSKLLSDEENKNIYGKCNNLNGHGHNYVLEVILRGEINPTTGMVLNLNDLKEYISQAVIEKLDHKNLDLDVPEFSNQVSTTENLAIFIWNSLLKTNLSKHLLYEIKLYETENNFVIYRGELADKRN